MIVGLDIGNTSTLAGIYLSESAVPEHTLRFDTERETSVSDIAHPLFALINNSGRDPGTVNGFIFSSVVREVNKKWIEAAESVFKVKALMVTHESRLKTSLQYEDNSLLGPDRITNAEAAYMLYGGGIIIDMGTAVTICAVKSNGDYRGGIIIPGPKTASRALNALTSLLPETEVGKPPAVTARNTLDAIRSGIFYGWAEMINGLVRRIKNETSITGHTILTGGFGTLFSGEITHSINDPWLTMKGLRLIYEENI